jgi:hypothetical protein
MFVAACFMVVARVDSIRWQRCWMSGRGQGATKQSTQAITKRQEQLEQQHNGDGNKIDDGGSDDNNGKIFVRQQQSGNHRCPSMLQPTPLPLSSILCPCVL